MAALGKSGKPISGPVRRASPLKSGLRGSRNWATAQMRAANYNPKAKRRLIFAGFVLLLFVVWSGLWLGGFLSHVQAASRKFTKTQLMKVGFVVDQVDVVGEGRMAEEEIRAQLGIRPGDYLFDMNIESAQKRVQSLHWVETATIRRLWPNKIVVYIHERTPHALWQSRNTLTLIDAGGEVITRQALSDFRHLPLVVGAGAAGEGGPFLKTVFGHEFLADKVEAIVYVGERRWDLVTKNGLRILLPEQEAGKALASLGQLDRAKNLFALELESIDMRVEGRLYLRPKSLKPGQRA